MESINIQTIVKQSAEGNEQSFRMLYDHLVERVYGFVAARVSGTEVAKEVTQDSFVELHKALPKFVYHSDLEFYAFVFTIARRQLAKRYTEQNKHKTESIDDMQLANADTSLETVLSVRSALEHLDDCSREIVVLHHWSRFTFAEIGTLINMTESAVRVRHHRARATLASILNS